MLMARFYLEKVEDRTASLAQGMPVWKDEERCAITIPGDREEVVIHIITPDLLNRWRNGINAETKPDPEHVKLADQYDRWHAGQEEPETGTPLELCGFLTPAQIENLKSPPRHCKTVEGLADFSDAQGSGIPFFFQVREKAKRFLEARNGPAALATRLTTQDALIAKQAQQIGELTDRIGELLTRLPAGGGAVQTGGGAATGEADRGTGVMPDDDIGTTAPAGTIRADASVASKARSRREKEEAEAA